MNARRSEPVPPAASPARVRGRDDRRRPHSAARGGLRTLAGIAGFGAFLLAGAGGVVLGQAQQYRIVPESSALRVIAYREGVFSLLAHDHVLLARDLSGRVTLDSADVARSAVSLRIGVAGFEVDPPQERERLGFVGEFTEGNRRSVREALLGPEVLNAATWPTVTAATERVTGKLPQVALSMRLRIRDKEQVLTFPVTVGVAQGRLTASGRVEFKQSDFGITPFQMLLGAIAVQDRIMVQFDIVAVPQP